jgi:hypothetical protein
MRRNRQKYDPYRKDCVHFKSSKICLCGHLQKWYCTIDCRNYQSKIEIDEKNIMTAYKVVREEDGKYISSGYWYYDEFVIIYKLNEWINTNHACCFTRLEEAEKFATTPNYIIFKCEIVKEKTYPVYCGQFDDYEHMKPKFVRIRENAGDRWEKGTIFASRVKLLKEIKRGSYRPFPEFPIADC